MRLSINKSENNNLRFLNFLYSLNNMTHITTDYSTEKGVPICLHQNRFFRMMFNGYFHYLEAVHYSRGVVIIAQFANKDFLVVNLRRAPLIGYSTEFPRGGVDLNESYESAVERELKEETGYSCESVHYLGKIGPDTATLNGFSQVYLAKIKDSAPVAFDTEEIETVSRISLDEFKSMVKSGEMIDGMSLAAFALYCLKDATF